jgi:hypothetical protein
MGWIRVLHEAAAWQVSAGEFKFGNNGLTSEPHHEPLSRNCLISASTGTGKHGPALLQQQQHFIECSDVQDDQHTKHGWASSCCNGPGVVRTKRSVLQHRRARAAGPIHVHVYSVYDDWMTSVSKFESCALEIDLNIEMLS